MPRLSWLRRKRHEVAVASQFHTNQSPMSASHTSAQICEPALSSEPEGEKSLWDQAYDELREEKPDLVKLFEEILLSEPDFSGSAIENEQVLSKEKQLSALVDRKLEIMNQKQWRFKVGGKSFEVREQVDRIVKVVLVAKDFISSAASLDPLHAGLPWAAVCILLPLVVNDSKQRKAATDGLEYVTTLVRRFGEVERTYLQSVTAKALNDSLCLEIIKLYKNILEYQAKAACQYNRNTAIQIARNTIQIDSWQGKLEEIKAAEASCDKILRIADAEDQRASMTRLEKALQEQVSKVSELLEISRAEDSEQGKLLLEFKAGREDQREWNRNADEAKCYACLRTTNYELAKKKNPDRIPGTCEWFLRHPKYQTWLDEPKSSWLWVTADPGCGKSVLSRHLIEEFERTMQLDTAVCYYFFKDDSSEGRSAIHALCAMVHQLLSQRREIMGYAVLEYQRNGEKLSTLFDTLWGVFCSAASDQRCGNVICVLDALDECEESSRLLLVERLARYYTTPKGNSNVKFIVTSRPSTLIGDAFWLHGQDPASIQLMGENPHEMEAIAIEVSLVIKERVKQFDGLRQRRGVYDDAAAILQAHLDGIENRTYLWVSLIFPELEKYAGSPKGVLMRLMKTLPTTIDEVYERILHQSRDVALARKLLHIVVAAVRPLTLWEMKIALSVKDGESVQDFSDLEAEPSFKIAVRELCGLFVNIQDRRIYLIHQTAKEFLVNDLDSAKVPISISDLSESSWKHSLKSLDSNLVLAKICTSYLLWDRFVKEPLVIEVDDGQLVGSHLERLTKRFEFLDYSAKHWSTHVIAAEYQENLVEAAAQLCNTRLPRFLTWFQTYWFQFEPGVLCPQSYNDVIAAAYLGHAPVVRRFLENDDNHPDDLEGKLWVPLWCAARQSNSEVVSVLLSRVPENLANSMGVWRALHAAAFAGAVKSVKLILVKVGDLATQVDPIAEIDGGWTLLHRAAHNGHEEVVRLLLDNGADVTAKSFESATVLDAAQQHKSVAQLLMSKGATLTSPIDWESHPAIIISSKQSDQEPLKKLNSDDFPSLGNSLVFSDSTGQILEMDDGEATREFSLSIFNAFIREMETETWRMSDAYMSRNLSTRIANHCINIMEMAATTGFRQISHIGSKLRLYATHRVEKESWIEPDLEKRMEDWVDPTSFIYELDDEICLEKFWTALHEFRTQLSVASKLLQAYYDKIP